MTTAMRDQYLIQIDKKDIAPVFLNLLELKPNIFSPFFSYGEGYDPNAAVVSDEAKAIVNDRIFADIAKVLAYPQIKITVRTGGGTVNLDESLLLSRMDGEAAALVTESADNSYYIQIFGSFMQFAEWWAGAYAGKNEKTAANYIPPKTGLGEFIFILHAIDYFRRASYKTMLDYAPSTNIKVDVNEFAQTMAKAMQSRDIRWLLPAFAVMTPGMAKFKPEIMIDDIKKLYAGNFLGTAKSKSTGEEYVTFGEAGKIMGAEFLRTWMICAGFGISVLTPEGIKEGSSIFIAPTSLSNHFVLIAPDKDGGTVVNHQSFTRDQLVYMMNELFTALRKNK